MSADTPRPERVTLSDEDVALLAKAAHCAPDKEIMASLRPAVERILAAREQARSEAVDAKTRRLLTSLDEVTVERDALRCQTEADYEQIQGLEAERDALIALLRANSRAAEHAYPYCLRCGREDREAKAEAWDEGFEDGSRQDAEGDDGPQFSNPYRDQTEEPT